MTNQPTSQQPSEHESVSPRPKTTLWLLGITLVGLGLRLFAAWQMNQRLPDDPAYLWGDEQHYQGLANALFQGSFFEWPGRTPIYPLFIAGCHVLFNHSIEAVRNVQAFLGASVIVLTFLLARQYVGRVSALVAAAVIATHPSLIFQPQFLLGENLYTPMLMLSLLSLMWALKNPAMWRFSLSGLIWALTSLCRPTSALFCLLIPLLMPRSWAWQYKLRLFVAHVAAIALVTAPWVFHNYLTYHAFLPYSVSLTVLWQGSPEFYHLAKNRTTLWINFWDYVKPEVSGVDMFTIAGDRYFTARAIASIKSEPMLYIWYCLQKLAFFWVGNDHVDWPKNAIFNIAALRPHFLPRQIAYVVYARTLPLIALAGLVVLRHRWKELSPLLLLCAYFMVIHALTYAIARYSEPLYPIVATMIVTAASELQRRIALPT